MSTNAHYMLRRNLPLWKPMETVTETIDFCRKCDIGEIIWKIDAEEFNHGFTPHALIREYIKWLREAKERQEAGGIIFSINPWLTQNHLGRMRYAQGPPSGFWWRMLPEGTAASEMACPLSPGWRVWLVEAYRLYAATRPDKLWIEDDFKTFCHQGWKLGCYCDAHLAAFSEAIGKKIDRERLMEAILRPGMPDPIRKRWFDFNGRIMVDLCQELETTVHTESPTTRLGLMSSWSSDGRWWSEAIGALAGPLKPLARTSLAPYEETRAPDFLPDRFDILKESACLPPETENCPELENSVYTAYSKSSRMTRLQIALSQVLGNPGITMNLFDMVGNPTGEDPRLDRMLTRLKPILDGLAGVNGPEGRFRGVAIPFNKRYADYVHAEPELGFDNFRFDGDGWCAALQGSGIPVVLNGEGPVFALTGQTARALTEETIKKLLAGGVLLDGSAGAVLHELGYGSQIGVQPGSRIDRDKILLSAEKDQSGYMSLRHNAPPGVGRLYPLTALPATQLDSSFVDPDHRVVMPGMTLFENPWGGRVATYPFDLSMGTSAGFMNWQRRRQLQRVIQWLGRGTVDLFAEGGAWMMPARRDYPNYILISVLNFETDDWDDMNLTFGCGFPPDKIGLEMLQDSGSFKKIVPAHVTVEGPNVSIKVKAAVRNLDFAVLRFHEDEFKRTFSYNL